MAATKKKPIQLDQSKALAGVLAMLVADREERIDGDKDVKKTEVILAGAGLGTGEIAALTGKKTNAVSMTISRAAKPKKAKKRGR
jgi:hypothetical protein